MAVTEKIELLGKYQDIPSTLTLKSIPTASELDYVSAEDFDKIMLDKILPQAVEEDFKPRHLLEIDYQWVLRALRILNYGPYHTTNRIFCPDCSSINDGEYHVDFRNIDVVPLPEGFKNDIVIKRDEFIDFDKDFHLHMLTIDEALKLENDKLFKDDTGKQNTDLARLCYEIHQIGNNPSTPLESRGVIASKMSPADYKILTDIAQERTNYGLVLSGHCECPNCHSKNAMFIAPVNDRFFRVSLADLRLWKLDKDRERVSNTSGSTKKAVSKNM